MELKLKENLRQALRDRDDMSVSSLARKSGVPKSNIQGWLDGVSPNLVQLDKVAKTLGMSIEYLAFGRSKEDRIEELLEKVLIHTGLYEVTVKKVSTTKKSEE